MYLAYWIHYENRNPHGAIASISDDTVVNFGHDNYYELYDILWNHDDDLGVIRGKSGNKDIVNFEQYDFMKTFDILSDAVKHVVQEMFNE